MEEILAHGIPRGLQNNYKVSAPDAIVVKFARIKDRNTVVLQQCRKVRMPKGNS